MTDITVGSDPEFFIRRGNHWISGHIFECGTKENPQVTLNGKVQVDGVALECNVLPSKTAEEFVRNCRNIVGDLHGIVRKKEPKARVVSVPSIFLGARFLSTLPLEASDLGCSPDWNAYTGRTNPRPNKQSPIRTGSGHIHLGWTSDENPRSLLHVGFCRDVVREMDYTLGLPSLLWDRDTRRRSLYGQPGAFRPKEYGLEYRVLSNGWFSSDNLIEYVFRGAIAAFENVKSGDCFSDIYGDMARRTIVSANAMWPLEYPEILDRLGVSVEDISPKEIVK